MAETEIVNATRKWVEDVVVGLNLCPFAKRELVRDRVRFVVSDAQTEDELLQALHAELQRLEDEPDVETTLLIHPGVLQDFAPYNEFLDAADGLLVYLELEGVYQVASFHPQYQFGGTQPDDAENYTNRSPFPMLHLLREESLERAIEGYPDPEGIPERNIQRVEELGVEKMRSLLAACFREECDDGESGGGRPATG
ncbi:DUF1415 domain-containing protein [uncultured Marinobacter sp.]|uniref:DUF1415 domain-containing protein n=1 Tax=uncultured Marinobacter sp. TaxID=187379 RepID=UPI00260FD826|nr:DUF1415 domain-containing protein [uncultured Marinobacter sp.]